MNIGKEIDTRIVTPARTRPAKPSIPQRDVQPAKPARPVRDPDKAPVKAPVKTPAKK